MIRVENLKKEFKQNKIDPGFKGAVKSLFSKETITKVAVDDISFEVGKGEIVGYLGPNGAGKSTTIKMVTGILTPTSGKCTVDGLIPYENRIENARKIGVVFGQRTQLWWDLPLSETFALLKKIYGVEDEAYRKRLDLLRKGLGLDEFMGRTVRTLSLGQRMRADLAAALIHNPKVIYLDEPTIGLDIVVKDQIRELIRNFREEYGTTVMLTTHDMSDIEELCKRILVIDKGKLIYDGDLKKLKDTYGTSRTLELTLKNPLEFNMDKFKTQIGEVLKEVELSLEGSKLSIVHNKEEIDTVELIGVVVKYLGVKDIEIKDMPVSDIIKKIYKGEEI